jgi:outer membrane lipoprotein SlyB
MHSKAHAGTMGVFVLILLGWGCSSPRPILYPNSHLETVGQSQADGDIADCRNLADEYVASNKGRNVATSTGVGAGVGAATGAVGGAVLGHPGLGAGVGAATGATGGLLRGLFRSSQPSPAYKNFVNHCLKKRGYEPIGWDE